VRREFSNEPNVGTGDDVKIKSGDHTDYDRAATCAVAKAGESLCVFSIIQIQRLRNDVWTLRSADIATMAAKPFSRTARLRPRNGRVRRQEEDR
jgi:hypothetical protein